MICLISATSAYAVQSFAKRFDYLTIEGNHRLHDLTFIVIRHYRYVRQRN